MAMNDSNDTTTHNEPMVSLSSGSRWTIMDTWNGGKGGIVERFTSPSSGNAGENECMEWIHKNTSFSFYEATTNQGYKVVPYMENRNFNPIGCVDPDDLEVYCSKCMNGNDVPDMIYEYSLYVETFECFSCGDKLVNKK